MHLLKCLRTWKSQPKERISFNTIQKMTRKTNALTRSLSLIGPHLRVYLSHLCLSNQQNNRWQQAPFLFIPLPAKSSTKRSFAKTGLKLAPVGILESVSTPMAMMSSLPDRRFSLRNTKPKSVMPFTMRDFVSTAQGAFSFMLSKMKMKVINANLSRQKNRVSNSS